jgi:hypothetical protein
MLFCSLMFLCGARPARPQAPASSPSTSIPADPSAAIPPAALQEMFKRELGNFYAPQTAPNLQQAHLLLEKYFAAPAAERKAIVAQIELLGLDPNIVGRIARIRLYWPALKGGVYYINERVGPHPVIYFLGVPDAYDRAKPWPLVIKLPGAHAFITDPPPGPDEVLKIYTDWIKEELGKHPDAVVLMPMLNLNELWGPSYAGMNSVIQPMHHVAGRLNIDPQRVYLLGHGMSAHATWNLALHYPTYFAAINPMAGGASAEWQRLRTMNLRNIFAVA